MKERKPSWLRAKLPSGPEYGKVRDIVDDNQLHTVCQSAQCPNMGECWSRGTATLMILGNVCTRACTFCCLLYTSPSPRDLSTSRMPSSAWKKATVPTAGGGAAKKRKEEFLQAEDGIRDVERSRGLGDVYKRQQKVLEDFYGLQAVSYTHLTLPTICSV